ncbi:MAG: beta-ketoacyl-ACP synthase II [Chloroflexales bacterium]|nr:beta-ketoacyl-ACP synthase II [Chloroflexales bacterium]
MHTEYTREKLRQRLASLGLHDVALQSALDTLVATVDPDDLRVVVTVLGVAAPNGVGVELFWQNMLAGKSGVGPVTVCDPGDAAVRIAAQVPDFDPREYMDAKEARRISRASQLAVAAARMAVADAQLDINDTNRDRIGAMIADGSSSAIDTEQAVETIVTRGSAKVNPFYITLSLPNMPSCQVSIQLGLTGYNTTIATACAASTQSIGEAVNVLLRGDADVILAGGSEAPIARLGLASFAAARALSMRNDEPQRASRPFDVNRDGFVLGEGAGVLVLERLSHAKRRGATIIAEVIGYGSTSDAYHVTSPHPEGRGAVRAMQIALKHAHLTPTQVDHINAHATSTHVGDIVETAAIKQVFGDYAYKIPITASKSMIGHLTAAAGAVEAVATVLTLRDQIIPPTINLEQPDPLCDLDYVPNVARPARMEVALSNSFGFGGINAVIALRRWK